MPDIGTAPTAPEPVCNLFHALKASVEDNVPGTLRIEPAQSKEVMDWMMMAAGGTLIFQPPARPRWPAAFARRAIKVLEACLVVGLLLVLAFLAERGAISMLHH